MKLPEILQIHNKKFSQRYRAKKTHSLMVRVKNVMATVDISLQNQICFIT